MQMISTIAILLGLVSRLANAQCAGSGPCDRPDAIRDLEAAFEEDTREGFLQHALLHLSWTPPLNAELLQGYELVIEYLPPAPQSNGRVRRDHNCSNQDPVTLSLPQPEQTNYTVQSVDGSPGSLPLYTCNYTATLVSLPGRKNMSIEFLVEYTKETAKLLKRPLTLECTALYIPEEAVYSITASWSIAGLNPLAIEALLAHPFQVINTLISVFPGNGNKLESRRYPRAEGNETEFEEVFTCPPISISTSYRKISVKPEFPKNNKDDFFWREDILPGKEVCNVFLPPSPPTQVPSESIMVTDKDFNSDNAMLTFSVSWDPPNFQNGELECYELCIGPEALSDIDDCMPGMALKSNDTLSIDVSYQISNELELAIQIRAVNQYNLKGNWSEPVFENTTVDVDEGPKTSSSSPVPSWVYIVIVLVILFVVVSILVVISLVFAFRRYCFHRCYKQSDEMIPIHLTGQRPWSNYFPGFAPPVVDEWELRREDVELMKTKRLGEGAFGEVCRALLQPKAMHKMSHRKKAPDRKYSMNCVVAVKMLKDTSVSSEKANFLREIEMMKTVSGSNNDLRNFVVNMIGCVTVQEPMLLVLEFVKHGDLQSYMRSIRKKFTNAFLDPQEDTTAAPYLEPTGAYSTLQPKDEDYEQLGILTERNLVDFARQIAAGMEYLSSLGIVHRDLACRNILVGDGKVLKVSDFGMSRLLPPEEVYVPTSHGLLPLRWMAIEALFYRHFSSKTDVWSYGVLLWEICTMGGFPYPTLSNRDLPELLRSGYRMDKPETCSQEVYEVMLDCWSLEAEDRPTFPRLHAIFDEFLTTQTQENYPYMEVLSKPYHLDIVEPTENPDTDRTPVNLDIQITDVDADEETTPVRIGARGLARSLSHNEPRNLRIVASDSHLSLRDVATPRSANISTHSSIQDMQAELLRQTSWQTDDNIGDGSHVLVNTRYVESPTNLSRHNSTHSQHKSSLHHNNQTGQDI